MCHTCGIQIPAESIGHVVVATTERPHGSHHATQRCRAFCNGQCAGEWLIFRLPWELCVECQTNLYGRAHFLHEHGPVCDACLKKGEADSAQENNETEA